MSEGRPLRYPYTTGAMLMQFPYKFHYKNAWVYRAWVLGLGVTFPIMCYVTYKQGGHKGIRYPPPAEKKGH